jgi:hypothetical protein
MRAHRRHQGCRSAMIGDRVSGVRRQHSEKREPTVVPALRKRALRAVA